MSTPSEQILDITPDTLSDAAHGLACEREARTLAWAAQRGRAAGGRGGVSDAYQTWLDHCAWHAMQGLLRTGAFTPEAVADDAYRLAAAMLAEKRRLEKV